MPGPRPRGALALLACLAALWLAGGASAKPAACAKAPAAAQQMRVSYAGAAAHPSADAAGRRGRGGRGRGSKGGAGGGNATQHCFTIAPAAAAAGNQSACATPQCCGAGLKLVKAFVVISPSCRSSAADRRAIKKAGWALGGASGKVSLDKGAGEVEIDVAGKGADASAPASLCVTIPAAVGNKKPFPCATLDKLCGPGGCGVRLQTGRFDGGSKKKPSACCDAARVYVNTTAGNDTTAGGGGNSTAPQTSPAPNNGTGGGNATAPGTNGTDPGTTTNSTTGGGGEVAPQETPCEPGYGGPSCDLCGKNFWSPGGSDAEARPDCKKCPSGMVTLSNGSTNESACVCRPGHGGEDCDFCMTRKYSPGGTAESPRPECLECPEDFQTKRKAADSVDDCAVCRAGRGGEQCRPCGLGYYSDGGDLKDQRPACTKCPTGFSTYGTRSHNESRCQICAPGYGGPQCTLCEYNYYSAGGNTLSPRPPCTPCPTGTFTLGQGAGSAGACARPGAITCRAGYMAADGACHICPIGTYSAGGTADSCTPCPGTSTTRELGTDSLQGCVEQSGYADGSFSWTSAADERMTQKCRQALVDLFASPSWDSWLANQLTDSGSCNTPQEGLLEIQVFYELGILADNTTAGSLLKPSTPGSITLDWGSSLGISSYEVAWGSIGSAQIASWTLADNLTDIYASLKDRISLGPLLTAARNASETTRSEVLSLLAGDLAERKSAAYTRSSGQMSKVRTSMWLVVRALKDAIEELVPGLRPAEVMEESEVRWVTLDLPTAAVNARKLLGEHRADGDGMREISLTDNKGKYRNLLCYTGLYDNSYRASRMALQGFGNMENCMMDTSGKQAMSTEVKYSKFSSDQELSSSLSASMEVKASVSGVNMGAGASYATSSYSASQSVYVMAMASKQGSAPLSLPDKVPALTEESLRVLKGDGGEDAFKDKYGSHFILGFKMGGYITFTYEYQANQRASKKSISAKVSVEGAFYSGSASASSDKEMKSSGVNIKKSCKTNTALPTECGDAVMGDDFKAEETRGCIHAWLELPATAAYSAFAVPFAYHPDYQAALNAKSNGRRLLGNSTVPLSPNATNLPIGDSEADYRFKETGLLNMRLSRISSSLSKYKVKEDEFFRVAQRAVEKAQDKIDAILDGLRNRTIVTVDQWQPMYNEALSLLHVASVKSEFTPKGAKCGWCTRTVKKAPHGKCNVNCSSTLSCSVTGDDCPTSCLSRGYTYESIFDDETGAITPTCKVAITGLVCEEYGNPDQDQTGGYHCLQQVCVKGKEYCDGDEELLPRNVTACMGTCKPVPYYDALSSVVRDGIPRCISGADAGVESKSNGCVYSLNRVFGACMVSNQFVIYNYTDPDNPIAVSKYTLKDAVGDPVAPSLGPFTACMEASGNFVFQDAQLNKYFETRTGDLSGSDRSPYRAVMENTGNFAVYDSKDTLLWETGTAPSWLSSTAMASREEWDPDTVSNCLRVPKRTYGAVACIPSSGRKASLCLHWDGQIAVYDDIVSSAWEDGASVLWTSGSNAPDTAVYPIFLCVEDDGNLRATDKAAKSVFWQSGSGKQGTAALFRAAVADNGTVMVTDAAGAAKWASPSTKKDGTPIRVADSSDFVIHAPSYDSGTKVELREYYANNKATNQLWTHASDGSIQLAGSSKCLAMKAAASKSPIVVQDCTGDVSQRWFRDDQALKPYTALDKCLNIPKANAATGQTLEIAPCTGKSQQQWTASFVKELSGALIFTTQMTNQLVVDSGSALAGTQSSLTSFTSAADTQLWEYTSSNQIKLSAYKLCLALDDGSYDNNAQVKTLTCADAANQKWFRDSDGLLRPWSAPDLCLTAASSSANATAGTKLKASTCNSSSPQQAFDAGFVDQLPNAGSVIIFYRNGKGYAVQPATYDTLYLKPFRASSDTKFYWNYDWSTPASDSKSKLELVGAESTCVSTIDYQCCSDSNVPDPLKMEVRKCSNENAAKSVFKLGDGATVRMNIYSTKNGQKVDNDRCWTLDTSSTSNTVTSGTQLYMSKCNGGTLQSFIVVRL